MKEYEVKYGDGAGRGTQAVTEEEIKGMTIPDVVKHLGWETIKEFDNGEAFYGNHTPHGQNLYLFNIRKDHMAQDIMDTATASWRTEEELFRFWVSDRNNGMNSLTNDEIIADSKVAIQMYHLLADAVKMAEKILQTEKVTDMNEFSVVFNDCEYDDENDVMTTTGKANINGKEYDVTFTEHDGKIPNVNISNTDIEMGYSNGSTIDGYGLETGEGKALYDAADTIYRAVFDAADDFQHRDPDAICARISYENKGIETEEPDIQIEEMSRNTGDVGDLVGVVRINEDTLRFTADRDGSIYSLMPTAAAMQDVRTVPISDEVKTALCDAIREGIVNYIEHEENPAKNMAYPPIAPDEIKGMSVDEVIEYCDWYMDEHEDGSITLESHSPAGEDLIIETTRDSLVDDLRAEAENFDPDEHAEMWVESRGTRGVPESIRTLVEDAEAIQQKYFQLSNAVEMAEKMQEKARSNDMER